MRVSRREMTRYHPNSLYADISSHFHSSTTNFIWVTSTRSSSGHSCFWPITFDRIEIEIWDRRHCVPLVETRRMMGRMTFLGQGLDLTSGQVTTLTEVGHDAYRSKRLTLMITTRVFSTLYSVRLESGIA